MLTCGAVLGRTRASSSFVFLSLSTAHGCLQSSRCEPLPRSCSLLSPLHMDVFRALDASLFLVLVPFSLHCTWMSSELSTRASSSFLFPSLSTAHGCRQSSRREPLPRFCSLLSPLHMDVVRALDCQTFLYIIRFTNRKKMCRPFCICLHISLRIYTTCLNCRCSMLIFPDFSLQQDCRRF